MLIDHITRNQIKRINKPIVRIPHEFKPLAFFYGERIGYNAGIYGWNFDVFDFEDAVIVAGCRLNNICVDYFVDQTKADAFMEKHGAGFYKSEGKTYEQKKAEALTLIDKLISDTLGFKGDNQTF